MQADNEARPPIEHDRLIDGKEVQAIIGAGHSKFYEILRDADQDFPRPVRYSARMVRFSRNAVLRWVAAKTEAAQSAASRAPVQRSLADQDARA